MRFYPNADISQYWDIPSGWSLYCHNPHKSWRRSPLQAKHTIAYWCDLKGARKSLIMQKDLYFKNWPHNRIRPEACLPWYYCVGNRFIRVAKAFPAGFKCSQLPMSLKEVQELKKYKKQAAKRKRAKAKADKILAKEREKLANRKKGMRV